MKVRFTRQGRWGHRVGRYGIQVDKGPGAGCKGGWTLYATVNAAKHEWEHAHRGARMRHVAFGITRNANRVPYVRDSYNR